MTPARRFGGRIVVCFLLYLLLSGRVFGEDEKIVKITILGNEKVSEDVIRSNIKSKETGPLSIPQLREDLKSIYEMGFFTDVIIDLKDVEGGKEVVFVVVEKPSIRNVRISGNVTIKTDKIKEEIDITPGSILNMENLKETTESIKKLYSSEAYSRAEVDYRIDYLDANQVDVEFIIEEGKKGYIKKIRFHGNEHVWGVRLRRYIKTKKKGWFWWLLKTGTLDEDLLEADLQIIRAYYYDHGYMQVKIDKPQTSISEDGKWITIDITIHEGEQFKVGKIDFAGDILTTKEDLFKLLSMEKGKVHRSSVTQKDLAKITNYYADAGYAYVEVDPRTSLDPEKKLIHITFNIRKGKKVYLERINVSGNTKTRDKVIRREVKVTEGDLYSSTALKRGRQKLKTTGYFKEVEFTTSRGTTDEKINVDIGVEEAPTGAISFGAGYSTLEGVVGMASVSESNLFGLGYKASLSAKLGGEVQAFKFGFTDPWIMGTPTSAGLNVYYDESAVFDTYSSEVAGASITFGRYLTDYISASLVTRAERVTIFDVSPLASEEVKKEEGTKDTISLSLGLKRDTRDDFFNPTKGSRHSLMFENAGGIFGGDNTFYKIIGDTGVYFPLLLNTVLSLRGRAGIAKGYDGKDIPIYEKFYVGGINTIRGFEYGEAGPKDKRGEVIGAEKMVVFNSEFIFPLSRAIGLRGSIFYDGGAGWDKKFDKWNHAVGIGIRWFSPMGPIRIYWGYNLDPEPDEQRSVWDFTFGAQF